MAVDAHVHVFDRGFLPAGWFDLTRRRWAHRTHPPKDASSLDIEGGLCDPGGSLLLADMEAAEVDAAICLTLDWELGLGAPDVPLAEVHARYGQLQRDSGGRVRPIAGVDPRRPDALDLLTEALDVHGLGGLKLYPPRGYLPGDAATLPLIGACVERDLPVVIHTAFVGWPHRGARANPLHVGDAQVEFPDATFVLAHSGHPLWFEETLQVTTSHPSTYAELSNWNELLHEDPDAYVRLVCRARDVVGAHRIIFGSDQLGGRRFSGSRSPMRSSVAFVRDLPAHAEKLGLSFTSDELELFLDGNARRAFRLDRDVT